MVNEMQTEEAMKEIDTLAAQYMKAKQQAEEIYILKRADLRRCYDLAIDKVLVKYGIVEKESLVQEFTNRYISQISDDYNGD